MLLSVMLGVYFFMPPLRSFQMTEDGVVIVGCYVLTSLMVAAVIGDVRRKERALRHIAIKQSVILESEVLGAATIRDRRIVWANRGMEKLLEYGPGELSGVNTRQIYLDEATYQSVGDGYRLTVRGETFKICVTMLTRNGRPLDVSLTGKLLDDSSGETLWLFSDVTARVEAERILQATTESLHDALVKTNESEGRYRLLAENANDMIVTLALDATLLFVTPAVQRVMGYTQDEVVGTNVMDFVHADDSAAIFATFHKMMKSGPSGPSFRYEVRARHKAGYWLWLEGQPRGKFDESGFALSFQDVMRDITARKIVEAELRTSRGFLARTSAIAGVGGWQFDVATGTTILSDEALRLHDIAPGTVMTYQELSRQYDPASVSIIDKSIQKAIHSGQPWDIEVLMTSVLGRRFWARSVGAPEFEDGRVIRLVGAIQDVSELRRLTRDLAESHEMLKQTLEEQRRAGQELAYRATHDTLTGLRNRSEFELRIAERLSGGGRARQVVLYIDLDQFKIVNDACGHSAGDDLLRHIATLLSDSVRNSDVVARLGGDEFGILLENCDMEQASIVAQKICDQVDRYRFPHEGKRYRVGTSIGVVAVDERWQDTTALLKAADIACYAAKEAGRNRIHILVENDHAVANRQGYSEWAGRLQTAIDEDHFELFGQTVYPISDKVAGAYCEVLIRLPQTDAPMLQPGLFIPAAERFYLATKIDRWVVRRVFSLLETNDVTKSGIERIAINLSGQSIGDRAFHQDVLAMVRAASFDVRILCFEITETAAITNLADACRFIEEVRALGVRVALDDFGAGASSFSYLKNLQVDYIKIDGQFIRNLLNDRLDQVAVRCFVDCAKAIGVVCIAEWIENADVLEALKRIGVDMAQGFLLHEPEPLPGLLGEGGRGLVWREKEGLLF